MTKTVTELPPGTTGMDETPVTLGVWEIGVDRCHLCDREAVAAAAWAGEEEPRLGLGKGPQLVVLCPEHATQLKVPIENFHTSCYAGERQTSGDLAPCPATATHVPLVVFYEQGGPQYRFFPGCRRHARPFVADDPIAAAAA